MGQADSTALPRGTPCFVMGNNRIIGREHFREGGKPLDAILGKIILDAGKEQGPVREPKKFIEDH